MSPDLIGILPELVLIIGGLALLVLPWIRSARLLGLLTLCLLIGAADLKLLNLTKQAFPALLFSGMFLQDRLSLFFQLVILGSVLLVTLSLMGYARQEVRNRRELYSLLLLTTVGLLLVVGAQHLALVYIGLELVSVLSYLLAGIDKRESLSIEGALKYFLFGSLATGTMLYGISLLYGLTGTMDLTALATSFSKVFAQVPLLATVSLLFLVVGIGFKIALVPFHMWAPDAYEGAPTPVTAFFSVGPKLAGFAILIRVFLLGFSPNLDVWPPLFIGLAVLTMTFGNVVALVQTNIKRLLAYSSIAHAGTMAIGLGLATPMGLTATLYYLVAYLLMNIGAFAGAIAVENAAGRQDLGAFAGLSQREPVLALMMTIALLSLAGIPPMAGFFAKMWIFGAAIQTNAIGVAVIAALNSVIALFYYAKIIRAIYLDPAPAGAGVLPRSRALQVALGVCTIGLFVVGLWPGRWMVFIADTLPLSLRSTTLPWM